MLGLLADVDMQSGECDQACDMGGDGFVGCLRILALQGVDDRQMFGGIRVSSRSLSWPISNRRVVARRLRRTPAMTSLPQ